jgi:caffeoyl-CoA O-methyltransferase
MPRLVNEKIEQYALEHTSDPGGLFKELAAEAQEKTRSPGMMSGPTVGYFLNTLVFATGALRVLEVGTFVGYSALMMASALPEDGELITCDVDPEATAIARKYWARSPHGKKITLKLAPALETMARLRPPFDLVFIDADKENYPNYYERAMELLGPRGVIVVDNVLWGGKILKPDNESGEAIAALNDRVQADERVKSVLLTVRDGLLVIRRV